MFKLTNECGILRWKKEGAKPLALLLFSLRPFGFAFTFRLDDQADCGDDCEKRFRKVFDYFA